MQTAFSFRLVATVVMALVASTLLAQVSYTSSPLAGTSTKQISDTISKIQRGEYALADIDKLERRHIVEAVPYLQKAFAETKDVETRRKLASTLVRFGNDDPQYWNYLVGETVSALDRDAPYPVDQTLDAKPTSAFQAWSRQHGLSTDEALQQNMLDGISVLMLATTGDLRGIPLLRRGLQSSNPFVVMYSAQGLALDKDKASVGLMVDTATRVPAASGFIAGALVYFDEPEAKDAVDAYLGKEGAASLREKRAQGLDVFGR